MPTITASRLMRERKIYTCQVCHLRPAEEVHHCLYGRRKGVPELDVDYNFQLTCQKCHRYSGLAKQWKNKLAFWEWACSYYGRDVMVKWHESLPLKVKEIAYK